METTPSAMRALMFVRSLTTAVAVVEALASPQRCTWLAVHSSSLSLLTQSAKPRGSRHRLLAVPFGWFRASPGSAKPNFEDFEVMDGGQTVRLGQYEAAVDAILYEFDSEARARMKSNAIEEDETFGGALRRLRLARGISLRLMFDPKELRPHVMNWETVAEKLLQRLHLEATGGVKDSITLALLAEILDYPDVRAELRRPNMAVPLVPIASICFRHGGTVYDFFSTVTTLGTPQDVTLEELRIESFFPANAGTERQARAPLGA
jgi:MmyB-like transcription regulator ligand binding domain